MCSTRIEPLLEAVTPASRVSSLRPPKLDPGFAGMTSSGLLLPEEIPLHRRKGPLVDVLLGAGISVTSSCGLATQSPVQTPKVVLSAVTGHSRGPET